MAPKILTCLIFAFGSSLSAPVWSQDDAVQPAVPPAWSQDDTVSTDVPHRYRYYVMGEFLGISVAPVPSLGLAVGIETNQKSTFELSYSRGFANLFFMNVGTSVWSGKWRFFFGESFNLIMGLGHRRITATFGVDAFGITDKFQAGVETRSLVSELGIGNLWRFDQLVIGCDWIGWLLHLQMLEAKRNIPFESSDADEKNETIERIFGRGSLTLLKAYVGYRF